MAHDSNRDNPHTRGVASFVANLVYDDIPREVRQRIKLLILDALGCGLYGAKLPWSRILIDRLTQLDDSRGCGIWGTDKRTRRPTRRCSTAPWSRDSSWTTCTAKASSTSAR